MVFLNAWFFDDIRFWWEIKLDGSFSVEKIFLTWNEKENAKSHIGLKKIQNSFLAKKKKKLKTPF